jgi:hypothetical protein
VRKALWSILLFATVVVGTVVLFVAGQKVDHGTSHHTPAVPLPPATTVAGDSDPVVPIPGRPTRIRVELDSSAPTADISFSVPWAAELDAPVGVDHLTVTGYVDDRGAPHQVRCRILVAGVVVETEQRAGYASCTFSLTELGG